MLDGPSPNRYMVYMIVGQIAVAGSLIVGIFVPGIPLWICTLAGIAIAIPIFLQGMRASQKSESLLSQSESFWPTISQWWAIAAVVAHFLMFLIPFAVCLWLGPTMPTGDDGRTVAIRMAVLIAGLISGSLWFLVLFPAQRKWFEGHAPKDCVVNLLDLRSPRQKRSLRQALSDYSLIAILALFAISLPFGVYDAIRPWLVIAGTKPTRGLPVMFAWWHDHPNSMRFGGVILGLYCAGIYTFFVLSATREENPPGQAINKS